MEPVPAEGFNREWLKYVHGKYVFRSRAVGKDGVKPRAFLANLDAECDLIVRKVSDGSYALTRYREKLIARGANRPPRQISIPTIRDRLALRGALEYIKQFVPESKTTPPHQYVKDIKAYIRTLPDDFAFLRMDIKDFYPSLRHSRIQEILSASGMPTSIVQLIMAALQTPTGSAVTSGGPVGVPQGLSISNLLASAYMIEFDKKASELSFYRRYVDDIIVIDHCDRLKEIHTQMRTLLAAIGLNSHSMGTEGKTETAAIGAGVQYLGYQISKSNISIRKSSLAKMFDNLSRVLTSIRTGRRVERHLFRLNLKITGCIVNDARRGWLMFFSQSEDISQLAFLDEWLVRQTDGVDLAGGRIKTLKKSYYEIRYNLTETSYIPNFDNYDLAEKSEVVRILSGRTAEMVEAMDVETVEAEFAKLVGREVSELERDMIDMASS
jgi:RNA-directed DNA polymerase